MGSSARMRILLKLSGEALAGQAGEAFSWEACRPILEEIAALRGRPLQLAIVVGGGNIYRGREGLFSQETGDRMGMTATVLNGLALREFFGKMAIPCLLQSAYPLPTVGPIDPPIAREALERAAIVIFCGGTGLPYFSTDTAAALRALDVGAELLLKASPVDGVYDADPRTNPAAHRLDRISCSEALARGLKFMDTEALCLCRSNRLPAVLFSMERRGALADIIDGKSAGTTLLPE
ncbi:MAG: uridine monophosphate kinase [Puniceicoccales bacterium]|nr:uridine monophosphate kinase [Puniceicoccales bacterium]